MEKVNQFFNKLESYIRNFILVFLFINFSLVSYSQVIKGTILDKQTKSTIGFASVYFNGTFVGTTADQRGNFELDISKNASMQLTISSMGYYSFILTDFSKDKPLIIYLIPKINEINEVVIHARSLTRERKANLYLFKHEFLGLTANARNCEIMNENDITFNYGADRDTLKAFASKPILIENWSLGYKITYYLDKFEYYKITRTTVFIGNIIFNEDLTIDKTQKQFYESRRKKTYLGSRMHFFRVLWSEDSLSNRFNVKNSQDEYLNIKNIVFQDDDNKKFLKYFENLNIEYSAGLSTIIFLKKYVYFGKNGYFDPSGINWKGEMAKQRIADLLPYEYSFEY
jgi:hypothetical protein